MRKKIEDLLQRKQSYNSMHDSLSFLVTISKFSIRENPGKGALK
jgi:hypothetical protein